MSVEFDTSEWEDAFDAGRLMSEHIPTIEVVAPGHEEKLAAAQARGDLLTLEDEDLEPIQDILLDGLAEAMATGDTSGMSATAEAMGEALVAAVSDAIQEGLVEGPARSPAWERKKGNTTNLVGLGDEGGHLHEALTYELVD